MSDSQGNAGIAGEQLTSVLSTLRVWVSETNEDGRTTGVNWLRLAFLSLGGWLLSIAVGIAQVLEAIGVAAGRLTSALGAWYTDYLGAVVDLVTAPFETGFAGALAWLDALGVGIGPIGLAIVLIALYLWVTIE